MEVILKQDIPNVGRIGDLVKVKNGYARNYLIPRQMAVVASIGKKAELEHQKRLVEAHKKKVRKQSEESMAQFKGLVLSVSRRVNEAGKLFGSVSTTEVAELLNQKGFKIDRADIELASVREAGSYPVKVRLPGDVFAEIKLDLIAIEEGEKKTSRKASAPKTKGKEKVEASGEKVPLKRKKKSADDASETAAAPSSESSETPTPAAE